MKSVPYGAISECCSVFLSFTFLLSLSTVLISFTIFGIWFSEGDVYTYNLLNILHLFCRLTMMISMEEFQDLEARDEER